ncbi:hypothetical protein M514_10125 [Trichuris suis]|uniref:Uncharacterized protein n=1 Tax=Trichuris suis TaxID=68888 RepID=A0A085N0F5_9BILA|nr:hypothetical protein M514_10125 [Trichuris suis]
MDIVVAHVDFELGQVKEREKLIRMAHSLEYIPVAERQMGCFNVKGHSVENTVSQLYEALSFCWLLNFAHTNHNVPGCFKPAASRWKLRAESFGLKEFFRMGTNVNKSHNAYEALTTCYEVLVIQTAVLLKSLLHQKRYASQTVEYLCSDETSGVKCSMPTHPRVLYTLVSHLLADCGFSLPVHLVLGGDIFRSRNEMKNVLPFPFADRDIEFVLALTCEVC